MATRAAQRYMPIRGPRFTDKISIVQARQSGGTLGELVWGAAAVFEALEAKSDREKAQAEYEHEQAGELASIRAKNEFADWQTALKASDGYHDLTSEELLERSNAKIAELVGGMSGWERQAAELDLALSTTAAQPVAKRAAKEHQDRLTGLFTDFKLAERRGLEAYSEYARAFATAASAEEQESLFQAWQVAQDGVRQARKAALGKSGWTADAQEELETELAGATRALMRDAFRNRAVREGTVSQLYGHVANRTDTLGPGGERIFEGVAPDTIANMRQQDEQRGAARRRLVEAQDAAAKRRIKDEWERKETQDRIAIAVSDNPLEAAVERSEARRREGAPYADNLLERELLRAQRIDDAHDEALETDGTAKLRNQELMGRIGRATEDELDVLDAVIATAGPTDRWDQSEAQIGKLTRFSAVRRAQLGNMSEEEKEVAREWDRRAKPVVSKWYGYISQVSPVYHKSKEAEVGVLANHLERRVFENFRLGSTDKADMERHVELLDELMMQLVTEIDPQTGAPVEIDAQALAENEARFDRIMYGLFDSGEGPPNEVAMAKLLLPQSTLGLMAPSRDGETLPPLNVQIEHITRKLGDRRAAERIAGQLLSVGRYFRIAAGGASPEAVPGERREMFKAIRFQPQGGQQSLADPDIIGAVQ